LHAYEIVGWDPNREANSGGTVTLANPWNGTLPGEGQFDLTLDELVRYFGWLSYFLAPLPPPPP
jgi:hypothetical protein